MTSYQSESIVESRGDEDFRSASGEDMELELEKLDDEFRLSNSDAVKTSSRGKGSCGSTSEVFGDKYSNPASARKILSSRRDAQSARTALVSKNVLSSIPLRVRNSGPVKPLLKNARTSSRTSNVSISRVGSVADKHTLEIQFINKNKTYQQLKKELLEKQKPVLDMYQNLLRIKKRLEELGGKKVTLDEVKLIPFGNMQEKVETHGAGEQIPVEVVSNMKHSIEEIPRTLMDICKNLLSRRALIVELLESVTKSELDVSEVSDKIESLKSEGMQLQSSLDAVISEHQSKINELVKNWQNLLTDKQTMNADAKIEEMEVKLREQAKLTHDSNQVIQDLQKKLDDKKVHYDKSVAELNGVISTLKEQIKKMEQDLDNERKSSVDTKSRMTTNSQAMKSMKTRMAEMESEKKAIETQNSDLQRKVRVLQDQIKHKDSQWSKEKEEMSKNLKHQENLLQKLTQDKNSFESRLEAVEDQKVSNEEGLTESIERLTQELNDTKEQLAMVTQERDESLEKCAEFEQYIARMGLECRENMNKVTCSIDWGKHKGDSTSHEAESYIQEIAKDLKIRELEDSIKALERDKMLYHQERMMLMDQSREPTETERELFKQQECVSRYQMLLEDSENKLKEKSMEVANLRAEIRQLRVRQEALEEQNYNCPTEELQKMVENGRHKLNELMKKSMESEQKLEQYAGVIEKQSQQMAEMENLLRYRENMAGVLKASRDELVIEKESLTRYSQEMRTVLSEVTKEGKMKDRLIKDLQDKIDLRERQISKFEKEVRELEANLMMTNEKRFKLQETVGTMEKELQSTKKHVNQLADINTRSPRNNIKIKPF